MLRVSLASVLLLVVCAACRAQSKEFDWQTFQAPAWQKYQARNVSAAGNSVPVGQNSSKTEKFTFGDLKTESDQSLASRLLGAPSNRITYIDRHRDGWRYYDGDKDAVDVIDLYTHPYPLGSQFGLCGVEKYTIRFDDNGRVRSVEASQRYGIEGPIFQKRNFDWDAYYNVMCTAVPASHAPSYFPAPDVFLAENAAELLVAAIDLASGSGPLPFQLNCRTFDEKPCLNNTREYLSKLRLEDVDALNVANCPPSQGAQSVCFTIMTGENQLGPFPKYLTIRGSTYMNNVKVDSVDVRESFTVS